ncbi:MAG: hypothetical protein K6A90_00180 [Lachnospiraceae bacterium]|nr:hypothetical protein [Lachnospiraceae bacterium]
MDQLRCVVERITYQNPENGYTVIKCRAKKILVIVGTKKALALEVKNVTVTERNTRLKEYLEKLIGRE